MGDTRVPSVKIKRVVVISPFGHKQKAAAPVGVSAWVPVDKAWPEMALEYLAR